MSVGLSVSLSVSRSVNLFGGLSVDVCLSVSLLYCLSVCLSVRLSSIREFTSIRVFTHLSFFERGYGIFDSLVLSRSDPKHTSASRKILAQVQEASKRMAAELEAKHANSKVLYA